ncbi:MAG: hypothetical protein AB8B41_09405 [Prochlorococcus sp.]
MTTYRTRKRLSAVDAAMKRWGVTQTSTAIALPGCIDSSEALIEPFAMASCMPTRSGLGLTILSAEKPSKALAGDDYSLQ